MIPSVMQLLGLLPGPTGITLFLALWVSGTFGWLVCYSIIGKRWMKNRVLVRRAKVVQQGFESLARSSLFIYLLWISIIMGGFEGVATVVFAFLLVVQSVFNMRYFMLFNMGFALLVMYLVLISSIYDWLYFGLVNVANEKA
jgi:hypothetical protein